MTVVYCLQVWSCWLHSETFTTNWKINSNNNNKMPLRLVFDKNSWAMLIVMYNQNWQSVKTQQILGAELHTYNSIGNASLYSQTCIFLHHHTTFLHKGIQHCRFYWCSAVLAKCMGASINIKKNQAATTQAPSLSLEHQWFCSLQIHLK